MKGLLKQAQVYKMAILMIVLFSVNSLTTAIVGVFLNSEWGTLSPTSKFITITMVVQNWSGTLLAFFNRTMSKLEQGESPFTNGGGSDTPSGGTEFLAKSQLVSTQQPDPSWSDKPKTT